MDSIIIKRIVERRKKKNLLQSDIAQLLGTTQQQISKYEQKQQELPLRHFIKLSNILDTSLDYFVGQTDNPEINK